MPDLSSGNHLLAIAFTAGFHFGFIEQAGTSLYATLSQKVTSAEVLKITISIVGAEIIHFQVCQDKAGKAIPLIDNGINFVGHNKNHPQTFNWKQNLPQPCTSIMNCIP